MRAAAAETRGRAPTKVLSTSAELEQIAAEWLDLAAGLPRLSYFATPDWVLSWWDTLGRDAAGRVGIWRDTNGRLQAVVPLGVVRHRLHPRLPIAVRVCTNLGSGAGAADHCGWAVLPERAADVRAWLAGLARRRPLLLSNLDPDSGVPFGPQGAHTVGSTDCPRVAIPPDPDAIGSSAKFRKQLRAYRRKIERLGITFRWVPPQQMSTDVLAQVVDLHARRATAAGWASTFTADRVALHRELVARADAGRGPAAVVAERDGVAVAALYGFRWSDTFAYYQTGWDAELADANLATVLVAEAIRLAGADGATVFDFLRGAESYKYRFGAVDRVDSSRLVPTGLVGKLLAAKYRVRDRREP